MSIIGALPVTLVNGTTADATQVMSDLNFIASQTNANAAGLAGGNSFTGTQTIGGDQIVTLSATQNLTNKTVNSDAIITATSIQTLANKTIQNGLFTGMASFIGPIGSIASGTTGFVITATANGGYGALVASGAPLDSKIWDFFVDQTGTYNFRAVNDTNSAAQSILTIARTATTISSVTFPQGAFSVAAGGLQCTSDKRVFGTAIHNNAGSVSGTTNQYIASGTYTPSGSTASNVSSVTFSPCAWMRVGNVVTVSGSIRIQASAAANTFTSQDFTLPIASTLSSLSSLGGSATGASGGVASFASMGPDTANNTCQIYFLATSVVAQVFTFSFQYLIS